jgi:hypothetical protein
MMRATGIFALAALMATPALAASFTETSQPLTVLGDVPVRCKMSPPLVSDGGANTTFSQNGAGGEIDFTNFVDPNTGKLTVSSAQVAFPIVCTGAQTLTVTTQNGGLTNANVPGPAGGFAARADYTLNASWASATKSLQTGGAAASLDLSQTAPEKSQLVLNFTLVPGERPLEVGSYDDVIVVQLNTAQ